MEDLPDKIITWNILNRLTVRETGRTSVVSKRWRNLWRFYTSLDLDFRCVEDKIGKHTAKCVDYMVEMHQGGSRLDAMIIAMSYNLRDAELVYKRLEGWLKFGNEKRVKTLCLNLQFSPTPLLYDISWPDEPNRRWDRLTTVSLRSVFIDARKLQHLILSSPNLETLSVENAPYLQIAIVESASLKHLEMLHYTRITTIHIVSAPNLLSLTAANRLRSPQASLRLDHNPKLSAINLGGQVCKALITQLPHLLLQRLQLDIDEMCFAYDHLDCRGNYGPPQFPTFPNLKRLDLRYARLVPVHTLHALASITSACPILHHLTLGYHFHLMVPNIDVDEYDGDVDDRVLSIRVIRFLGWAGLKLQVRSAHYLIRNCPNLESITFDPTPPHPMDKDEHLWESAVLTARAIIQVSKQKQKLPATVQSIIICKSNEQDPNFTIPKQ